MKYETVAIGRSGLNFLNTEGADFACKVTYLAYVPGEVYNPQGGVKQELLIPILVTI